MQNYWGPCKGKKTTVDGLRQRSWFLRKAPGRQEKKGGEMGKTFGRFFYGGCMIVLAVAATSINAYDKMYGFVETAESAIALLESSN